MAFAELNESTTTEEIQAMVDDLHQDRMGEDAPKSDAEIVNDTATDTEKTPVAKSDETAEPEGKGEKSDDRSWLDDDLKAEVAAYGIGEDELADYSTREELDRALRLFDKAALNAGRKAMADGEESTDTGRDDKGRFKAKAETERTPRLADHGFPASAEKTANGYVVKLDKSVYDDQIVDEFTRLRDHYEQERAKHDERLAALESRFIEVEAKAEEQRFDSLIDALGHTDLFGKTDNENDKQLQRRKDLHVAVKAQMLGLKQLGRPTEMSESLINRVARMVFAEELGKKDIKSRTAKITKQSNGRQGGGATRPNDVPESTRDWADRHYRELAGV